MAGAQFLSTSHYETSTLPDPNCSNFANDAVNIEQYWMTLPTGLGDGTIEQGVYHHICWAGPNVIDDMWWFILWQQPNQFDWPLRLAFGPSAHTYWMEATGTDLWPNWDLYIDVTRMWGTTLWPEYGKNLTFGTETHQPFRGSTAGAVDLSNLRIKDRYLGWGSFYAQAGDPKFTPPRPPAGDGVWSAGESFDGTYWQFVSWF